MSSREKNNLRCVLRLKAIFIMAITNIYTLHKCLILIMKLFSFYIAAEKNKEFHKITMILMNLLKVLEHITKSIFHCLQEDLLTMLLKNMLTTKDSLTFKKDYVMMPTSQI
jgi:hypothetical protein